MDTEHEMDGDTMCLDVSSKARAKEFSGCKEGEKVVFELETTIKRNADGKLYAKIDDIVEYEKMEAEEEQTEAEKKVPKALAMAVSKKNGY